MGIAASEASDPEDCQAELKLLKDFRDTEGRHRRIQGGAGGDNQATPERISGAEVREMDLQGRLWEDRQP